MKAIRPIIISLFATLLVPVSANSNLPLVPEHIQLHAKLQDYKLMQVLNVMRVFTGNEAGRKKLRQLREKGYACQQVLSRLARCTDHLENPVHEDSVLQNRYESEVARVPAYVFGKLKSVEQSHESPAYDEWVVKQDIQIGNMKLNRYRLRHLKSAGLWKVIPGIQGSRHEILWKNGLAEKIADFAISHPEGFTRYMSVVDFE